MANEELLKELSEVAAVRRAYHRKLEAAHDHAAELVGSALTSAGWHREEEEEPSRAWVSSVTKWWTPDGLLVLVTLSGNIPRGM